MWCTLMLIYWRSACCYIMRFSCTLHISLSDVVFMFANMYLHKKLIVLACVHMCCNGQDNKAFDLW
jgi:hypothetical protein